MLIGWFLCHNSYLYIHNTYLSIHTNTYISVVIPRRHDLDLFLPSSDNDM